MGFTLDDLFPEKLGQGWRGAQQPRLPEGEPATLAAEESGYVTYIDGDRLLTAVGDNGAVVELKKTIGDYVFHGVPLAAIWSSHPVDDAFKSKLRKSFQLGKERELRQDFLYGVRQLTAIALRALSPGINDPSTAEQCIDAVVALLHSIAPLSYNGVGEGPGERARN